MQPFLRFSVEKTNKDRINPALSLSRLSLLLADWAAKHNVSEALTRLHQHLCKDGPRFEQSCCAGGVACCLCDKPFILVKWFELTGFDGDLPAMTMK